MSRGPLLLIAILAAQFAFAQSGTITVDTARPVHAMPRGFYGLMTEEINHAYDGGLYAEQIQNRAFRDSLKSPAHWSHEGGVAWALSIQNGRVQLDADFHEGARILNDGYWGIALNPDTAYRIRIQAKSAGAASKWKAGFLDSSGHVVAETSVRLGPSWSDQTVSIRVGHVSPSAGKFFIAAAKAGKAAFRYVSVLPPDKHALRSDIMSLLAGLKPAFLRLPGGNYLEGNQIADRYPWKETLMDVAQRQGHNCCWGYYSSDGMGMLEYLEWCEDLHMEPLLAVYAGYSLEHVHIQPGDDLKPTVQDALDEIEFVTGGPETEWGRRRAAMGHPKPFPLHYIEVGNEDWFDPSRTYVARYAQIGNAIRAHYPDLKLITTMPIGQGPVDLVDDHYYRSPAAMAQDWRHYEKAPRNGPPVFVGEWASISGRPTPNLMGALGDAAWLTGLERDSDVVKMESYAPLFVNVNRGASQWSTNLIGYDALRSFGSPSYWVQALFAQHSGDQVLDVKSDLAPVIDRETPSIGSVGLRTYRTKAEFKDLEVLSDGKQIYAPEPGDGLANFRPGRGMWAYHDGVYSQDSMETNTLLVSKAVVPGDCTIRLKARRISGDEGFMVVFRSNAGRLVQWNVGGWGNSRTALQRDEQGSAEEFGDSPPVTVEEGRWYDVEVRLSGKHITCLLDGKVVEEADDNGTSLDPLYAGALRDSKTGAVSIRVTNMHAVPVSANVVMPGARPGRAEVWTLKGQPEDQNSIGSPDQVAPIRRSVDWKGPRMKWSFPAYSVTVVRIAG